MDLGTKTAESLKDCLRSEVHWTPTRDAVRPWFADLRGVRWEIRVNDFPAEPMYTLFVAGRNLGDFDDWPEVWRR